MLYKGIDIETALNMIKDLKSENQHLRAENQKLKEQLSDIDKILKS